MVAFCIENGLGTVESDSGAFDKYLEAAKDGDAFSQYYVAESYRTGVGATKDLKMAKYWYRRGARQGDPDSIDALDTFFNE